MKNKGFIYHIPIDLEPNRIPSGPTYASLQLIPVILSAVTPLSVGSYATCISIYAAMCAVTPLASAVTPLVSAVTPLVSAVTPLGRSVAKLMKRFCYHQQNTSISHAANIMRLYNRANRSG